MPTASTIAIKVNGTDITNKVLYARTWFEAQLGAIPGNAQVAVKDMDQTFAAVTGDELTLELDGIKVWGGYVLTVDRIFAMPVVDTTVPANVKARQFVLSAVDYNILFDKRVIRNTSDYLNHMPFFTLDKTMGELLRTELLANYLDISSDGLDTTTYVDDAYVPRFDASGNPDPNGSAAGSWPQQGSYWRKAMEDFAQFGCLYYIDADKNVHFHEAETILAGWGFSDVPNNLPLPNAAARYPMREYEDTTDAASMANDAMVWGGSAWAGPGETVFARAENAGSIAAHGRWQYAETRFGDLQIQGDVTARANVISSGNTTGAVGGDTSRGLAVNQQQCHLVWFGHDVPSLSGTPQHLRPGQVVPITMYVLSEDGGLTPLELLLPLRSMKITFPALPSDGTPEDPLTYVRLDGQFGVQLSDPWWLWKLLRDMATPSTRFGIAVADGGSTATVYGAIGTFQLSPAPDGSETVFTIPFAYISGTPQVYAGPAGLLTLQTLDVDYTESDPARGEFTFTSPPSGTTELWLTCRVAGGLS